MIIIRAFFLLLLSITCKTAIADIQDNASCVVETYKEYTDVVVSMYEATNTQLKKNNPKEFELLKPCIDIFILDAKHKQTIVDRWWKQQPDRLFVYSKQLRNIGDHYDRDTVFKKEMQLCTSNRDAVGPKRWEKALKAQWRIQRDIQPLFARFLSLEKLRWPTIKCDK